MTSWPGIRDDMVNAGATWLAQEVVRDGNWVTSPGPQDMLPFVSAMTKLDRPAAPGLSDEPSAGTSSAGPCLGRRRQQSRLRICTGYRLIS